jgi:transcriptional regulator with XRE-family HTH domain
MLYCENNPSVTPAVVSYGFTNMDIQNPFGEWLREQLEKQGMKAADLARRSGVTKQNIGRILNNTPHSVTGALPKVEESTVEKLARALDADIDEARLAAGYAPSRHIELHGHKIVLPDDVSVLFPDTRLIKNVEDARRFEANFRAIYEATKAQILAEREGKDL